MTRPAGAGALRRPMGMPSRERIGVEAVLRVLLVIYIATVVLEGPLRWMVALSGWPDALYMRDAIPVFSLAVLLLRPLLEQRWLNIPILLAGALLVTHALVGVALGLSLFQVAFGLKILLYPVYGMAMWPLLKDRWDAVLRSAAAIFTVTLAGLALSYLLGRMPWEGVEYETALRTVTTTRVWWQGEVPRLPGFARASFNAAMILGITGLLTMVWLRSAVLRVSVAALAVLGILVTTSKGMLLAFPLAAVWLLQGPGANQLRTGRAIVWALCALGLLLPLAMGPLAMGSLLRPEHWPTVIFSAWQRFSDVWPAAFELLPKGMGGLLGTGVGGIGSPQLFGPDPHRNNPADSLAVFLLVTFGLAGALYYAWPAWVLHCARAGSHPAFLRAYIAVLMIAYGYGISISMIEDTFFSITLGLGFGGAMWAAQGRCVARDYTAERVPRQAF